MLTHKTDTLIIPTTFLKKCEKYKGGITLIDRGSTIRAPLSICLQSHMPRAIYYLFAMGTTFNSDSAGTIFNLSFFFLFSFSFLLLSTLFLFYAQFSLIIITTFN